MQNPFKPEPKSKKVKKMAKQMGRELDKEKRGINRDVHDFERQERKLLADIKQAAAKSDEQKCRQLARQLIRVRKAMNQVSSTVNTLDSVKMSAKAMAANAVVVDSMAKATGVMKKMNNKIKVEDMARRAAEYEREMEKTKMKEEMVEETLAAAFDDDANQDEEDEMVNKVLDEVGIKNMQDLDLGSVPMSGVKNKGEQDRDADLEELEESGLKD